MNRFGNGGKYHNQSRNAIQSRLRTARFSIALLSITVFQPATRVGPDDGPRGAGDTDRSSEEGRPARSVGDWLLEMDRKHDVSFLVSGDLASRALPKEIATAPSRSLDRNLEELGKVTGHRFVRQGRVISSVPPKPMLVPPSRGPRDTIANRTSLQIDNLEGLLGALRNETRSMLQSGRYIALLALNDPSVPEHDAALDQVAAIVGIPRDRLHKRMEECILFRLWLCPVYAVKMSSKPVRLYTVELDRRNPFLVHDSETVTSGTDSLPGIWRDYARTKPTPNPEVRR
ncbi:MAG: hypothetical protein CO095_05970 [Armatimonadetes bacterium CG_4_9_14_3_um_filter_58_7]|nr:MAG: hypothetical protein CO095_05970 [Armatimonadetes bacterium CG_4_9_14_3_um_filter_58_7]